MDQRWMAMLGVLHEYVQDRWWLPPSRATWEKDGETWEVGAWVATQRSLRKRGLLQEDRAFLLEQVPDWKWESDEASGARSTAWQRRYEVLKRKAAASGVPGVAARAALGGRPWSVGLWVYNQRKKHREGKLTDHQVAALEAIPGWDWNARACNRKTRSRAWILWLEALREYAEATQWRGFTQTEAWTDARGREWNLGSWVNRQRQAKSDGIIKPERAELLEKVPGWAWGKPRAKEIESDGI
jgi:hypothetical protein